MQNTRKSLTWRRNILPLIIFRVSLAGPLRPQAEQVFNHGGSVQGNTAVPHRKSADDHLAPPAPLAQKCSL